MPTIDLYDWLDETDRPGFVWYAKRLAANDTLATNAHQAGPYITKTGSPQEFDEPPNWRRVDHSGRSVVLGGLLGLYRDGG